MFIRELKLGLDSGPPDSGPLKDQQVAPRNRDLVHVALDGVTPRAYWGWWIQQTFSLENSTQGDPRHSKWKQQEPQEEEIPI